MSSLGNGMTECEMVAMQPENKHNSVVLEHIHTSGEFYGISNLHKPLFLGLNPSKNSNCSFIYYLIKTIHCITHLMPK